MLHIKLATIAQWLIYETKWHNANCNVIKAIIHTFHPFECAKWWTSSIRLNAQIVCSLFMLQYQHTSTHSIFVFIAIIIHFTSFSINIYITKTIPTTIILQYYCSISFGTSSKCVLMSVLLPPTRCATRLFLLQ